MGKWNTFQFKLSMNEETGQGTLSVTKSEELNTLQEAVLHCECELMKESTKFEDIKKDIQGGKCWVYDKLNVMNEFWCCERKGE